jgi:hypothetical protein
MKRAYLISVFLMTTMLVLVSGQESKTSQSYPWSVSLSYAPKIGLDLFDSYSIYPYSIYLLSLDLRAEHRFSDKFSYSFGIDFNRNHNTISQIIFDAPAEKSKSKSYLIEVPIQINYHIIRTPKHIDPYIKMSLSNSYLHYFKDGTIGGNSFSIKESEYFLYYDLGFGSNFKINEAISIRFESSIAYGLIHDKNSFNYLEGLLGISYAIKK